MSTAEDAIVQLAEAADRLFEAFKKRNDETTKIGEQSAAKVNLGPLIRGTDISFESDASSTMTVEVSNDGKEWEPFDTQSLNDNQDVFQYDVTWRWVRAYADDNLVRIEISAGGIQ